MRKIKFDSPATAIVGNVFLPQYGIAVRLSKLPFPGEVPEIIINPTDENGDPMNGVSIALPIDSVETLCHDLVLETGTNFNVCPCCQSDQISAGQYDGECQFLPVECEECGAEWNEQMVSTSIFGVKNPRKLQEMRKIAAYLGISIENSYRPDIMEKIGELSLSVSEGNKGILNTLRSFIKTSGYYHD